VGIDVTKEISSGENAVSCDSFKLIFPKCHSPCDCEKYKLADGKSVDILNDITVSNKFLVGEIPDKVPILLLIEPEAKYIPKLLGVDDE
jgi:hypothetical protein